MESKNRKEKIMSKKKIVLPKIADAMYKGNDTLEVLKIFNEDIQKLAGDFFYADQTSLKLDEAISLIKNSESENAVLRKIRDKWSKDLRNELVAADITYESTLRRKSVFSIIHKFNRTMVGGHSMNSIHDLMGIEFVILTPTEDDTPESARQLYRAANIILSYFSNSKKSGERFMLCDASKLKDVYTLEELENNREKILIDLQALNPHIYVPEKSDLLPEYKFFVKDYFLQPKKKGYQGIQFVVKTSDGFYVEFQLKTQPVFDFKNDPSSPIFHDKYRQNQTSETQKKVKENTEIPQFDLTFDSKKVKVYGFRNDPDRDKSGIIAPKKWDLRKNTHL